MSDLMEVTDVGFRYGSQVILKSVQLTAAPGEFLVLLGLNGAGKSTLLDILAGLRIPGSGSVRLDGRHLSELSARDRSHWISHLPQGVRNELPFTVEQVVLMGRYPHADRWFESDDDRSHADDAMHKMGCLAFKHRLYGSLSGGEKQRVLLAACLAQNPKILLFDEPSTYLDVDQQLQCFSTLARVARDGALCIAVTHDLNLALARCTRLLVLHDGRIAADVPVEQAAREPAWLECLSPRLKLVHTPEGRPWVLYQ
jgi:ABC-type cobalamin/Fe3+-siderophores transport system ATPase subunit